MLQERADGVRDLVEALLASGGRVVAHDPEARDEALRRFEGREGFTTVEDPYAAAEGADALVLMTEWKQ